MNYLIGGGLATLCWFALQINKDKKNNRLGLIGVWTGCLFPLLEIFTQSFLAPSLSWGHSIWTGFAISLGLALLKPTRASSFPFLLGFGIQLFWIFLGPVGAQFLWPIVNVRFSLSIVSGVEWTLLFFSLLGCISVILLKSFVYSTVYSTVYSKRVARLILLCVALIIGLQAVEKYEAATALQDLENNKTILAKELYPFPGELFVWRSVMRSSEKIWSQKIRVPLFGNVVISDTLEIDTLGEDFSANGIYAGLDQWILRTNGFVALISDDPIMIGDMRFSFKPDGFFPLEALRLSTGTTLFEKVHGSPPEDQFQFKVPGSFW